MADVDAVVGAHQRENGPGTGGGTLDPGKRPEESLVVPPAGRVEKQYGPLAPAVLELAEERLHLLTAHPPRLVLHRREGAVQDEGRSALGIGGGEHQAHWAAFRP